MEFISVCSDFLTVLILNLPFTVKTAVTKFSRMTVFGQSDLYTVRKCIFNRSNYNFILDFSVPPLQRKILKNLNYSSRLDFL